MFASAGERRASDNRFRACGNVCRVDPRKSDTALSMSSNTVESIADMVQPGTLLLPPMIGQFQRMTQIGPAHSLRRIGVTTVGGASTFGIAVLLASKLARRNITLQPLQAQNGVS